METEIQYTVMILIGVIGGVILYIAFNQFSIDRFLIFKKKQNYNIEFTLPRNNRLIDKKRILLKDKHNGNLSEEMCIAAIAKMHPYKSTEISKVFECCGSIDITIDVIYKARQTGMELMTVYELMEEDIVPQLQSLKTLSRFGCNTKELKKVSKKLTSI